MKLNLNEARQNTFEVIPEGETVAVLMRLHAGEDGFGSLTRSKNSAVSFLKAEFTVTEGRYAKRKFWQNFTLATEDDESEGHQKAINFSKEMLRSIAEAVQHIAATDESPAAIKARQVDTAWFDGKEFLCVVGIAEGTGGFNDQNKIKRVINPASAISNQSELPMAAPAAKTKQW